MNLRSAIFAIGVAVILFLVMPTVIIAIMSVGQDDYLRFPPRGFSLQWYVVFLTDPDWRAATLLTLKVATLAAIMATIIGTCCAVALIRGRLPGRSALRLALLSPSILPNIVTAIAIYFVFTRLHLTGTLAGFVIAHTVLATPLAFLCVAVQLQNVDPDLEIAARSLGAAPIAAFFKITLPIIRPAILVGAIFAFLTSFDEAVVSFNFNVSPALAAVATLVTMVTLGLLALIALIRFRVRQRKRLA
jgi:mannopine transport system permease protein